MTTVSFFLPAYKATFLATAIQSILNQTFKDFELRIVNDASPEDIRSIVSSFSDERIKYTENEINQGSKDLVAFWNNEIKHCTGEFLVIASDDDVYAPEYLQELLLLADHFPKADLFHCRLQFIDCNGNIVQVSQPALRHESQIDFIYQRVVWKRKQTLQEFLFRTTPLLNSGGLIPFPLAWSSDLATTYMMAKNGVVYTEKILFSSRVSGQNISTPSLYADQKIAAMKQFGQWIQSFLPNVTCHSEEDIFMKKEALRICSANRYSAYPDLLQELSPNAFRKEIKYIARNHIFSWRARLWFTAKWLFER